MEVTCTNLHVELGGTHILHGIDLELASGRMMGLIGANGSGKSTLLRTIYRVHRPSRGQVRVDGDDVQRLSPVQTARRISVMTQEISTDFPLTALDVALLGRIPHQRGFGADSPHDLHLAHQALREVGATHLADRAFGSLSGGEKQRILLARALAQQAPVMILDEPTNHADLGFQHDLLHLVKGLGVTVLAALHDVNLALTYCDDAAVLHHGRLRTQGPAQEVLTCPLVDDVLRVSSRRLDDPRGGSVLALRRQSA